MVFFKSLFPLKASCAVFSEKRFNTSLQIKRYHEIITVKVQWLIKKGMMIATLNFGLL